MATHENGVPDKSVKEADAGKSEPATEAPVIQPELPRWATKSNSATPFSDARMAAYIGPRWESTYRAKLAQFFADPSFTPTWNWSAALVAPYWFLYRKLYLAFLLFSFLPAFVVSFIGGSPQLPTVQSLDTPEGMRQMFATLSIWISTMIAAGGTGNWLLFRRARAAAMVVTLEKLPEDRAIARMQRLGGVNMLPALLFLAMQLALGVSAVLAR